MAASKLPANQIIGEAFGFVFTNLRPLARAAAVPFAVMTVCLLRMIWAGREGDIATYAVVFWLIIQLTATVPFQTQAYRFAMALTADSTPRFGWPWSMRETMFVLNAIGMATVGAVGIALLTFAALLVSSSSGTPESVSDGAPIFVLFMLPAMVVALYASARISLVFAAASVGRPTTWRIVWRSTQGNGWRLVWVMLVTILPWSIANLFLQLQMSTTTSVPALILLGSVVNVVGLIGMAVPATAFGLAYRHLAGASPPSVSVLV